VLICELEGMAVLVQFHFDCFKKCRMPLNARILFGMFLLLTGLFKRHIVKLKLFPVE